jgi:hypothetical protein
MRQDITSVRIDAELMSTLRDFGAATEVKITHRMEKSVATWLLRPRGSRNSAAKLKNYSKPRNLPKGPSTGGHKCN